MTGVARLTSKSSQNGGRRSRPVAGAQCALEFISAWPRKQPERDFVARKWELNLLATMAKTKRWGNQLGIGLLAMLTHHYRFVLPAGSGAKVRTRPLSKIAFWTPLSWLVGAALSRSGPSLYSVAARVQVEKRVVASASGPLDQNRAQ